MESIKEVKHYLFLMDIINHQSSKRHVTDHSIVYFTESVSSRWPLWEGKLNQMWPSLLFSTHTIHHRKISPTPLRRWGMNSQNSDKRDGIKPNFIHKFWIVNEFPNVWSNG